MLEVHTFSVNNPGHDTDFVREAVVTSLTCACATSHGSLFALDF